LSGCRMPVASPLLLLLPDHLQRHTPRHKKLPEYRIFQQFPLISYLPVNVTVS